MTLRQFSPVQHCFPVYGGGVEVHGVGGILQAYRDCLHNVCLSGPTVSRRQEAARQRQRAGCKD